MLGHGVGREPLLRVLRDLRVAAPESGTRTRVLFVGNPDEQAAGGGSSAPPAPRTCACSGGPMRLLTDFQDVLTHSFMGTRLYVAGPESFMGLAMRIARQFNLNKDEVRAEECGSAARRVYCIHCQTATENVTRTSSSARTVTAGCSSGITTRAASPHTWCDGRCRGAWRAARCERVFP